MFPTAVPKHRYKPVPVASAGRRKLKWDVKQDECLPLKYEPREGAHSVTAMARQSGKEKIMTLDLEWSNGRGAIEGVLLDFSTQYRAHRSLKAGIEEGLLGPTDVGLPEARPWLQLLDADSVDEQLVALGELGRIGPGVGPIGAQLVQKLFGREGDGAGTATIVRALEVTPLLLVEGRDDCSRAIALANARAALHHESWEVRHAAATAVEKIDAGSHRGSQRSSALGSQAASQLGSQPSAQPSSDQASPT
jgi:hypothetical protein